MTNRAYTTKEILQKDFKTSMRGYNPTEVDEFLDNVIRDYESFTKEIEQLRVENGHLMNKVEALEKQGVTAQSASVAPVMPQTNTVTNFDILKRLSNLEKHVFGSKLNEND